MNKMIILEEDQLRQIVSESVKQALHDENLSTKASAKDDEPLLTREQMAKELHISLVTITDRMKKGLPYLRLNGRIYFLRSEVMTAMKHNRLNPQSKAMGKTNEYLRIGTVYFKFVKKPLASGDKIELLLPWSVECIKQDHGKDFLSGIPRYDGFCLVPAHLNYQRKIENFYNRYSPFFHEPVPGYPKHTLVFLNHVFGEQLELGLDYFKILLLYPTQIPPILCLVSRERNTGKTTFLNFCKAIFGDNMTINSNEDFRINFNAEWVSKLLIGVDETFLNKKEDSERIKNLSTSRYYKVQAIGQDRQEIEFFGKFILCSNNEDSFIQIGTTEIRYWIRRLPPLTTDNRNLLTDLKNEIPFFIHYLIGRPFTTQPSTRMWFRPEQIATAALKHIKHFNRNRLETEMAQILLHIADIKEPIEQICFCISDMQEWLQKKGIHNRDIASIRKILQQEWKLKPADNSNSYLQYRFGSDGSIYEFMQKGRFYSIEKK